MPVISGGRWQRGLQKYLGIKGEVVASELAPEIYTTVQLGRGLSPELRAIFSEGLYVGTVDQPANVGVVSYVQLQNPVGSGVVTILEKWWASVAVTVANWVAISLGDTLQSTGLIHLIARDKRLQTPAGVRNTSSSLMAPKATGIAGGGAVGAVIPLIAGPTGPVVFSDNQPIVLVPGDAVGFFPSTSIGGGATNIDLSLTFYIRERVLESSETSA